MKTLYDPMPEEINNLTTRQLRALASQYKVDKWDTADIGTVRRKLLKLAETVDILSGENL
jgi:uncharacterized protein YacL